MQAVRKKMTMHIFNPTTGNILTQFTQGDCTLQLLMFPCCFYNFKDVLLCPQPRIAATIQFMIFSSPRILTSLKAFAIFSSTSKRIIF